MQSNALQYDAPSLMRVKRYNCQHLQVCVKGVAQDYKSSGQQLE